MTKTVKTLGSMLITGALWTVLMRMSIRLVGIISILILARLLTPEDYGLVAKATLVYGIFELMSQFGFDNALIKKQDADREDYNTVWTLSAIRGVVIGLLTIGSAYPVAHFLNEPALIEILVVLGIISLIKSATNVGIVNFRKDMRFDLDFKFSFISKIVSFVVTIAIAYIYQSYWALVAGVFANVVSALILSYIMSSYRPRLSISKFGEIMDFSKWVIGFEIISALSKKLDLIILSKFSSTANVGLFTVANEIASTPSSEISMPIARASMPVLSKLNHDLEKFREMYMSILSLVLFIAIPASVGLSLVAEPAVAVLLGHDWLAAGPFLQILALYGLARVINAVSISAYMAFDKPNILTKLTAITLVLRLIFLPLGFYLDGAIGLCWGLVIAAGIGSIITLFWQQKIGFLSILELLKPLCRVVIATLSIWMVLDLVALPVGTADILVLLMKVSIGVITFCFVSSVLYWLLPSNQGPEEKILTYLKERFGRFFGMKKDG